MFEKNQNARSYAIVLTLSYVAAFIALRHIFHEAHEFGHMGMARLLCDAWGTRDFNRVAAIPANCAVTPMIDVLVALAGPLLNYCAIWAGAILLLRATSPAAVSWGLTLIFASLPLARLVTAAFGGGDEMGVGRAYLGDPLLARVVVVCLVMALLAWPLAMAWRALGSARHRLWIFLGFLILPMLLEGAVVLYLLNWLLLQRGLLDQAVAFGAPALVLLVLLAALVVLMFLGSHIAGLARGRLQTRTGTAAT